MAEFNDEQITLFAETNFRGLKRRFGIKRKDRRRHMYIIGKTGMGKTTLMENMTIQDIQSGEGVGIVDPHGEYAERMLDFVPASRVNDVVYFNPSDLEFPLAFNVMEDVGPERRHLVSSGLLGVFKKIWGPEVWSGRMEYLLSNSILALLETPGTTLLGINRILADKEFRKQIVANVKDPIVKAFWENEYARYTEKFATEAGAAVQNKIGQFTSNPLIRNIIGQPKSTVDMRKIMDERKIFIMNLSKGRIGEENARLLGAMLITRLYLSAMTRVDIPEPDRADFYLYVDEFQNFATESFANILSEARKYRLDLILAHQYVEQMDEGVQAAVFGNVGSMATFRIGATDAELLEKELMPEFTQQDLVNLGFASIYLRLMIDGVASRPFSATTLPPVKTTESSHREEIIQASRKLYGRARKEVDENIMAWQGFVGPQDGIVIPKQPRDIREPRLPAQAGREWPERPAGGFTVGPRRPTDGISEGAPRPLRQSLPPRATPMRGPERQAEVRDTLSQVRQERLKAPTPASFADREPRAVESKPQELKEPQEQKTPKPFPTRPPYQTPKSPGEPRSMEGARERPAPPPMQKPEQKWTQPQPYRPALDIRRAEPKPLGAKPAHDQKSFLSLSQLGPKGENPMPRKEPGMQTSRQPEPIKKKVDFAELKKALSESFNPSGGGQENRPVMHDRTGMMKPRDPNAPVTKPDAEPVKPEERPGSFVAGKNIPPAKPSQGGVMKPGDRIKF